MSVTSSSLPFYPRPSCRSPPSCRPLSCLPPFSCLLPPLSFPPLLSRQNPTRQINCHNRRFPQRHVARVHEIPRRREGKPCQRHVRTQDLLQPFRVSPDILQRHELHRYVRHPIRIGRYSLPEESRSAPHRKARHRYHILYHVTEVWHE